MNLDSLKVRRIICLAGVIAPSVLLSENRTFFLLLVSVAASYDLLCSPKIDKVRTGVGSLICVGLMMAGCGFLRRMGALDSLLGAGKEYGFVDTGLLLVLIASLIWAIRERLFCSKAEKEDLEAMPR